MTQLGSSVRMYDWTRTGMLVISRLIEGTIAYNKAHDRRPRSFRDYDYWNVPHSTVRSYSIANTENPQRRDVNGGPLRHIAPHLYRFAGFNGNQVLFDPDTKYKSWEELAEHVGELKESEVPGLEAFKAIEPVACDEDIQLSITRAIPNAPVDNTGLLEQIKALIQPLRDEVEEMKRSWRPAIVEPQLTPMEAFFRDWIDIASPQQLDKVGADPAQLWEENRLAIQQTLMSRGNLDQAQADRIIRGEGIEDGHRFILCFLFTEPVSNQPYDPSFWDNPSLSIAVEAIAS